MALYEGMFLLDNDLVRAGWPDAKAVITNLVAKHGGTVHTARRWDERPLAYGIKRRHRATFLLVHFDMGGEAIPSFHRDLEIRDEVLRYLQLRVQAVPEGEQALSEAEGSAEFTVPEPPKDTPPQIAPELFAEREERRERRVREVEPSDDGDDADDSDDEGGDGDDDEPVRAGARGGKKREDD
jgi:small subunit ribosomal protein S6